MAWLVSGFQRLRRGLGLLFLTAGVAASAQAGLNGSPAPDFALKSTSGENLRLSEYRGSVVVLSFWASWCGRCRDALPELQALRARFPDESLTMLSINLDADAETARETAARAGLSFPVLLDIGRDVAHLYDPGKMPMTLLIDRHGQVRHVYEGYRAGDESSYALELEALLAD